MRSLQRVPLTEQQRQLAESQWWWVVKVARDYANRRRVDVDTCLPDACDGLMRAVQTYEPSKGMPTTYVERWATMLMRSRQWRQKPVFGPTHRQCQYHGIPPTRRVCREKQDDVLYCESSSGESPLDGLIRREEVQHLRDAVETLPDRERSIVRMRTDGFTLTECGQKLGITRERVRQIEARAIRRLQEVLK